MNSPDKQNVSDQLPCLALRPPTPPNPLPSNPHSQSKTPRLSTHNLHPHPIATPPNQIHHLSHPSHLVHPSLYLLPTIPTAPFPPCNSNHLSPFTHLIISPPPPITHPLYQDYASPLIPNHYAGKNKNKNKNCTTRTRTIPHR